MSVHTNSDSFEMSWLVWTGRALKHFSVSRFTGVDGRSILWKKCDFKNWISVVSCGQSVTACISKLSLMYQKMTCWTKRNWKFPQIPEARGKNMEFGLYLFTNCFKPRWMSVQWLLDSDVSVMILYLYNGSRRTARLLNKFAKDFRTVNF